MTRFVIRNTFWLACGFLLSGVGGMSVVWGGPTGSLTLLDGTSRSGEIRQISADGLDVTTEQGDEHVPANTLMQVEFPAVDVETGSATETPSIVATFVDRSQLHLTAIESDGTRLTLTAPQLPKLTPAIRQVADVRFMPLDDKIATAWEDLRSRNARDDLLVIRKGDVLDYVAGSVGNITPTTVTALVRDRELAAPRERIFGIIYAARPPAAQKRRIAVKTTADDAFQAVSLKLDGEQLKLTTDSLGEVAVPVETLKLLDYGGGRVRFLANLPFDSSTSKSPDPNDSVIWFVCLNSPAGTGGKAPLKIGDQEFRRGLWLHSGAVLRYRLNREFTQLRTTAGFELTHVTRMPRFEPRVRLVFVGDGKDLYSKEFSWNDPAEQIEIDLKDVRELTIRVDSIGTGLGILEHFALGEAQVLQ